MMKRIMPLALGLMLVLAACSDNTVTEKQDSHSDHPTASSDKNSSKDENTVLAVGEQLQLPNGDLQQVTASASELPPFLADKSEDMRLVYEVAGSAEEILKWMPCYCGCADSAGHESNLNCFVSDIREDGAVVWDDHGTRCNVCVEIAVKSVTMSKEGKSLKEIRQIIDEEYKEGYARPTDTPMPS